MNNRKPTLSRDKVSVYMTVLREQCEENGDQGQPGEPCYIVSWFLLYPLDLETLANLFFTTPAFKNGIYSLR